MMRTCRRLALAASLAGAGAACAACPPLAADGAQLRQGAMLLAWRTEPAVLRVGQPFSVFVQLCPTEAILLRVDANMPEHRHGMNYKTSLHPLGDGRWRVDGLLWHMAGRWEMRWDVRSKPEPAGAADTVRTSVVLQ